MAVLLGFSWCWREESNLRPTRYECVALPTELLQHKQAGIIKDMLQMVNLYPERQLRFEHGQPDAQWT